MAILGYLVNTVTINLSGVNALGATVPGGMGAPQGPILLKASEAISDPTTLAAVQGVGGIVANPNDPTIIAAVAICQQKMLGKYRGQNEDLVNSIMMAAYIKVASQGEVISYQFTAASSASETEIQVGELLGYGTITGAFFSPNAASAPAAPNGTNNDAFLLNIYNAAGTLVGQLAAVTLNNSNQMTKWVRFNFGALTNTSFSDGYTVTYQSTVAGTATRPIGTLILTYSR
jgi:hypothetical protein